MEMHRLGLTLFSPILLRTKILASELDTVRALWYPSINGAMYVGSCHFKCSAIRRQMIPTQFGSNNHKNEAAHAFRPHECHISADFERSAQETRYPNPAHTLT